MLKKLVLIFIAVFLFFPTSYTNLSADLKSESSRSEVQMDFSDYISLFYDKLGDKFEKPDFDVFKQAVTGFFVLKAINEVEKNLLTIVDFSLSSNDERMWIVDLNEMKIVHKSLVSHGRNSGELYASQFSNTPSSYKSSLGFYLTSDIYYGKHGMSLLLDGLEQGINDKARERAIVMHSADYVSNDFIKRQGRLGRSLGCPAIPMVDHKKVITMLSGRSCLFIYYPDAVYHENTGMFVEDKALDGLFNFFEETPGFLAALPSLQIMGKAI